MIKKIKKLKFFDFLRDSCSLSNTLHKTSSHEVYVMVGRKGQYCGAAFAGTPGGGAFTGTPEGGALIGTPGAAFTGTTGGTPGGGAFTGTTGGTPGGGAFTGTTGGTPSGGILIGTPGAAFTGTTGGTPSGGILIGTPGAAFTGTTGGTPGAAFTGTTGCTPEGGGGGGDCWNPWYCCKRSLATDTDDAVVSLDLRGARAITCSKQSPHKE